MAVVAEAGKVWTALAKAEVAVASNLAVASLAAAAEEEEAAETRRLATAAAAEEVVAAETRRRRTGQWEREREWRRQR